MDSIGRSIVGEDDCGSIPHDGRKTYRLGSEVYEIKSISNKESHWMILEIHYAHRIPSISYAFGLFKDGELVGSVTYGTPASSPLRNGICGEDYAKNVLELNRLVLINNEKGEASRLVGGSLKMLPKPSIVVSYADTSQNHVGIVYQATNFIYTGLSAKRTDWKIKGQEHLHGITIADKMRNVEGRRVDAMRAAFGDDFYLQDRPRKHRYIYFIGSKGEIKKMKKELRYSIAPYPKEKGK